MSEPWKVLLRTALVVAFISLAPGLMPGPWTSWTWTMQPPRPAPEPSQYLDRAIVIAASDDQDARHARVSSRHRSAGERGETRD